MLQNNRYAGKKFMRVEIAFFIVYFLLFAVLSDFEFAVREHKNIYLVFPTLPYRFISGILVMIPYFIYYKILLQQYLFKEKYLLFIVLLAVWLVVFNLYNNIFVNWLISKLSFLPVNFSSAQNIDFSKKLIVNFSIIYLARELMVITALAYYIRSAKQEEQMHEMRENQLQAELKYLKVQLQPHFFFNTLNNIYALALQKSDKAAPLVAKHAEMMRYIIYTASGPTVPLEQEINFLKNYTDVESVRYSEKIVIRFDTQGINDTIFIEPLLLLPFIENTFKHGLQEEMNEGYIDIIICLIEHELTLETKNSKALQTNGNAKNGIGLINVTQRLLLLYPGKHQLVINEDNRHYEVRLTINLQ